MKKKSFAIMLSCFMSLIPRGAALAFDHAPYDQILKTHAQEGIVDYAALKADRAALDGYVENLSQLAKDAYDALGEKDKIAFWLNAYNAVTLKIIIDHYPILKRSGIAGLTFPINSIRQIPGQWDKITHRILDQNMTLNQMEHEILRKNFSEPRVHMALVCAALGCPPLRSEAYEGSRLDAQLDDQAAVFLANPLKCRLERDGGKVLLSPILKWFAEDFIPAYAARGPARLKDKERAAAGFASAYLKPEDAAFLRDGAYDLEFLDYDWSLNDKPKT